VVLPILPVWIPALTALDPRSNRLEDEHATTDHAIVIVVRGRHGDWSEVGGIGYLVLVSR
jgi:hypothetical protein